MFCIFSGDYPFLFLAFYLNVNYCLKCMTCQRIVATRRGSVLIENGLYLCITTLLTARRMTLNPRVHLAIIDTRILPRQRGKKYMHTGKLRRLLDQSGASCGNQPSSGWCVMIVIILMSQRWKSHIFFLTVSFVIILSTPGDVKFLVWFAINAQTKWLFIQHGGLMFTLYKSKDKAIYIFVSAL